MDTRGASGRGRSARVARNREAPRFWSRREGLIRWIARPAYLSLEGSSKAPWVGDRTSAPERAVHRRGTVPESHRPTTVTALSWGGSPVARPTALLKEPREKGRRDQCDPLLRTRSEGLRNSSRPSRSFHHPEAPRRVPHSPFRPCSCSIALARSIRAACAGAGRVPPGATAGSPPPPPPASASLRRRRYPATDDDGVWIPRTAETSCSRPTCTRPAPATGVASDETSDYPDDPKLGVVRGRSMSRRSSHLVVAGGNGFNPPDAITQLRSVGIPWSYAPSVDGVLTRTCGDGKGSGRGLAPHHDEDRDGRDPRGPHDVGYTRGRSSVLPRARSSPRWSGCSGSTLSPAARGSRSSMRRIRRSPPGRQRLLHPDARTSRSAPGGRC